MGKPTRDMIDIGNAKIIPAQYHICNSVIIFSLVCYFPPHHQNNNNEPLNLRKSSESVSIKLAEIFKKV